MRLNTIGGSGLPSISHLHRTTDSHLNLAFCKGVIVIREKTEHSSLGESPALSQHLAFQKTRLVTHLYCRHGKH